jgi:hypothetical protein
MLISKEENAELYRYIFRDEDIDDLIFKNEELSVSEK